MPGIVHQLKLVWQEDVKEGLSLAVNLIQFVNT